MGVGGLKPVLRDPNLTLSFCCGSKHIVSCSVRVKDQTACKKIHEKDQICLSKLTYKYVSRCTHVKTGVAIGSIVSRLSTFSKLEPFQSISVHWEGKFKLSFIH